MKCIQWIAIYGDHAVNHQGRMREREKGRERWKEKEACMQLMKLRYHMVSALITSPNVL